MLRVGDANKKHRGTESVEKGLYFKELACQPVGMNFVVILTSNPETRHILVEPAESAEPSKVSPKNGDQTKTRKNKTQQDAICACLSLSGLALLLSIFVYL